MSFKKSYVSYPTAGVSKLLATNGGAHILNVEVAANEELFNGAIVKIGAYQGFDLYAEAAAAGTTVDMKVVGQAANGNYYVQVNDAADTFLVYNPPVVEDNGTLGSASEKNFYLAAGEVARAHQLMKYDIFELSADGFDVSANNSADVVVGDAIQAIANKKLKIKARG